MPFQNTIDVLGDEVCFQNIVEKTISNYFDNEIEIIGGRAFQNCSALTTINLPAATLIGSYAFQSCSALTTASLPAVTNIGLDAFNYCRALTTISMPVATSIGNYAFQGCSALTTVSLPAVTYIGRYAFQICSALTVVCLGNSSVAEMANSNAFSGASQAIFYVPDSLVEAYKSATNWSYYASRIKGESELPAT